MNKGYEGELSSRIMVGDVRHRRHSPVKHELKYPMFMPCIDLDEWSTLQKKVWGLGEKWWHWARFKRSDYFGSGDLKTAVQDKVFELTGHRFTGKVKAVLHLRYLGLYFSPVNFYYLYDEQGNWQYLLAEVTNTPWNQTHCYAVPAGKEHTADKEFHVSPFNPIEQTYKWKLRPLTERLFVHLECHRDDREFDATLAMSSQPFDTKTFLSNLITTPAMAVKVSVGIYWHALRLWLKKAPFYPHPDKLAKTSEALTSSAMNASDDRYLHPDNKKEKQNG